MHMQNTDLKPRQIQFPRTPKAVVFDLDGTLIDSEPIYQRAWLDTARSFGFDVQPEVFRGLIGKGAMEGNAYLLEKIGPQFPVQEARQAREKLMQERLQRDGVQLKPGAIGLLDELERLRLPIALATTTTSRELCLRKLEAAGLGGRFSKIALGSDVKHSKPAPDIFLKAAELLLCAAANCLAVEDADGGIQGAFDAGMMAIQVPDLLQPTAQSRAQAIAVIASLEELRLALVAKYSG